MGLIRFLFVLLIVGFVVSVAALGWPRFTTQSRPQALETVNTALSATSFGQELSTVLGVSTGAVVEPITPSLVANNVLSKIQTEASRVMTVQLVRQLMVQMESLPEEQKTIIRDAVCRVPSDVPESSTSSQIEDVQSQLVPTP